VLACGEPRSHLISERMNSIASLLEGLCPEVEHMLKPSLRGFRGMLIQAYLPQAWVFVTETETATFIVDAGGNAHVEAGANPRKDVTIRWQHDLLASVLRMRSRDSAQRGVRPTIMFHTSCGRRAFGFLKGWLGL
jgi:hypothetical protein